MRPYKLRRLCLFFCACSLILFLVGCSHGKEKLVEVTAVAETPSTPSSCLEGIVDDVENEIIVLRTVSGQRYYFARNHDENIIAKNGIHLGDTVTVIYTGELRLIEDIQDVAVSSITVVAPLVTPAPTTPSPTPIPDPDAPLKARIAAMSLEEKTGQLFIARCPSEGALESIKNYNLGSYILFGSDFTDQTPDTITATIQSYQEASELPMLIAVDEEGGTVNRVSNYEAFRETPFLSPQELYQDGGIDRIVQDTIEKANLLKSLGINVNMAPVCDISQDPSDFIYERSFGKDAEETADYVGAVVTTMCNSSIGSVLKHFPGYGNNADTHTGIAYDSRSYENFVENDFKPFTAGIDAGAGAVLVSHNIIETVDSDHPASLSAEIHKLLRDTLHFNGVIMTDDLAMEAITDYVGDSEAAVAAILAGNDLLCCSNFETQVPAVLAAVKSGDISMERLEASVLRVLKWKSALGLLIPVTD